MTSKAFIQLLQFNRECRNVRSYSGRAMYGARCVSVYLNGDAELPAFAATLAVDAESDNEGDGDDIIKILRGTRTDNMGLGTVVYWPSMPWPEDLQEDEEE